MRSLQHASPITHGFSLSSDISFVYKASLHHGLGVQSSWIDMIGDAGVKTDCPISCPKLAEPKYRLFMGGHSGRIST